jgi:hypothetical protein
VKKYPQTFGYDTSHPELLDMLSNISCDWSRVINDVSFASASGDKVKASIMLTSFGKQAFRQSIASFSPVCRCVPGRALPATALARAAAVQRTAGIQYPVAVGSVRGWTERSPRVDRGSDRPPLMMYFHRSTSGKLSRPLPFHCRAQKITKRGPPVRRIAWERKNLPSARLNPALAR